MKKLPWAFFKKLKRAETKRYKRMPKKIFFFYVNTETFAVLLAQSIWSKFNIKRAQKTQNRTDSWQTKIDN